MIIKQIRNEVRQRKHTRVRKKILGTAERPRLNVFRSLNNIYVQVIDDKTGNTLISASTIDEALKNKVKFGGNIAAAKEVGTLIAKRAQEAGISAVVFDRGGYIYHGRIQAIADAAREGGLVF